MDLTGLKSSLNQGLDSLSRRVQVQVQSEFVWMFSSVNRNKRKVKLQFVLWFLTMLTFLFVLLRAVSALWLVKTQRNWNWIHHCRKVGSSSSTQLSVCDGWRCELCHDINLLCFSPVFTHTALMVCVCVWGDEAKRWPGILIYWTGSQSLCVSLIFCQVYGHVIWSSHLQTTVGWFRPGFSQDQV